RLSRVKMFWSAGRYSEHQLIRPSLRVPQPFLHLVEFWNRSSSRSSTRFPYSTLFRSFPTRSPPSPSAPCSSVSRVPPESPRSTRSEEHTSELQSREKLVCRLLLEKKNYIKEHTGTENTIARLSVSADLLQQLIVI